VNSIVAHGLPRRALCGDTARRPCRTVEPSTAGLLAGRPARGQLADRRCECRIAGCAARAHDAAWTRRRRFGSQPPYLVREPRSLRRPASGCPPSSPLRSGMALPSARQQPIPTGIVQPPEQKAPAPSVGPPTWPSAYVSPGGDTGVGAELQHGTDGGADRTGTQQVPWAAAHICLPDGQEQGRNDRPPLIPSAHCHDSALFGLPKMGASLFDIGRYVDRL